MPMRNGSIQGQVPAPTNISVFEAMEPYLSVHFGNAASLNHSFGWAAQDACDMARETVAAAVGARDGREIVFTSSGLDADRLAILGSLERHEGHGKRIITNSGNDGFEDVWRAFPDRSRFEIFRLPVGADGCFDSREYAAALGPHTILVSLAPCVGSMEVVRNIVDVGKAAESCEALFHINATTLMNKVPVCVQEWAVDLLTLDSNGIGGPPGAGALYLRSRRPRVSLVPLIDGGGQEHGLRSGTLNVPTIVGFGAACQLRATGTDESPTGSHDTP